MKLYNTHAKSQLRVNLEAKQVQNSYGTPVPCTDLKADATLPTTQQRESIQ